MTFQDKLDTFVRNQKGKTPDDAQLAAHNFSQQIQEYAPKERWGNIFKYVIAYALGIGLGHALAAALTRGVDELAPPSVETEPLAQAVEQGNFDFESFDNFMTSVGCASMDVEGIDADGITYDEGGDAFGATEGFGGDSAELGDVGTSDVTDGITSFLNT